MAGWAVCVNYIITLFKPDFIDTFEVRLFHVPITYQLCGTIAGMPLTIYRRHLTTCRHAGKRRRDAWGQKCDCPIWVQGSLGGEYLRRSLDLVSWEAAQDRVRGWEASGEVGVVKAEIPEIPDAVDRFFKDVNSPMGRQRALGPSVKPLHSTTPESTMRSNWQIMARVGVKRADNDSKSLNTATKCLT
ncbi:MAG: hypothetical protein AUH43_02550 [Acidobacteria bacterium 13_1_40CM_65_14]|nr:MAG: hypothetical protein AUH43_02550 [Acidobacteria bacterium 13_1_40CM_65_14]OLE81925.1 MAG: hypothetical protein AUF76_11690 [Acidobacteria bacterium 13_1_20CM_2_65_9]